MRAFADNLPRCSVFDAQPIVEVVVLVVVVVIVFHCRPRHIFGHVRIGLGAMRPANGIVRIFLARS